MHLVLTTYNLALVERTLCENALHECDMINTAAILLGISRHTLKRKIIKHNIPWPRVVPQPPPLP